jgi:hypothetical protein
MDEEEVMFDIVGESVVHQVTRVSVPANETERDARAQKAEAVREVRPVEGSGQSDKSRAEAGADEQVKTRNRLEDGKVVVEKYDEDGRLVRRTPPGFLPFGEIA